MQEPQSSLYTQAIDSYNEKQYIKSLHCIQLNLHLHPLHFESLLLKAKILFCLNRFTNSYAIYDKCLKINPQSTEALKGKAYTLKELGYNAEAIQIYKDLNSSSPSAKTYNSIGACLYNMGFKEDAISQYNKAIELNPNYTEAYFNKGVCLSNIGKKNEAIKMYQKAIELYPNYKEAHFQLGYCYFKTTKYSKALPSLNKVIEIDENYADAYLQRGLCLIRLERYEEAILET